MPTRRIRLTNTGNASRKSLETQKVYVPEPLKPFPPQERCIGEMLESMRRNGIVLNTSGTGTGKTLEAVETVKRMGKRPVVVCPKAVVSSWERALDQQKVEYYDVLTYAKLVRGNTRWYKPPVRRDKRCVNLGRWNLPDDAVLIADEAQALRAGRFSLQGLAFVAAARMKIPTILLSATPFINPLDMGYFAYAFGMFTNYISQTAWMLQHGCTHAFWGGLEFVRTPVTISHMERINSRLKEAGILTKVDRSEMAPYFTTSFSQTVLVDYDKETVSRINSMQKWLEKMESTLDADLIKSEEAMMKAIEEGRDYAGPPAVVELLRARQEVELHKIPTIAEFLQNLLDEGCSVVVFLTFLDSINALEEMFPKVPSVRIDGRQSKKSRQAAIDKFQRDEAHIAFIQIQAGGAGLSLHDINGQRPRASLLSLSYSLIDNVQALGRIDRAGAKSDTRQFILVAANTIEEKIAAVIEEKKENLETLIEK